MNQREPTSAPVGAGQALPCLALLLLTLLLGVRLWARPAMAAPPAIVLAKPYLVALGSPPLRFEEPAPPPDLVTRPPASAPPEPAETETPAAETSDEVVAAPTSTAPLPSAPVAAEVVEEVSETPEETAAPVRTPQPILADDVRPQARPEDFLPYFQIPAPNNNADVIVPIPRTPGSSSTPLPPSSATYIQTP